MYRASVVACSLDVHRIASFLHFFFYITLTCPYSLHVGCRRHRVRLLLARCVNVFHLFVGPMCFIKPAAAIGPGDGG